ncbi:MAG: inorganic polyphosphate/ATP-NAD kinase [Actinomycetota bacterium]
MSSVLLVAHHERDDAAMLARRAAKHLGALGHSAWMTPDDAEALGLRDLAGDAAPSRADVAICIGGDGTTLRTVHLLAGAPVPIIGVNVGLLGYLTEVEPPMLVEAIDRWFAGATGGGWHLDERMMLDVAVQRDGGAVGRWSALNEAVLEKLEPGHTIRLKVDIDGTPFTSYAADGLILATPTGSTAYSFSARGPVLSPRLRALLLTPVSPHMLFDRSLTLDASESVAIEVVGHRVATLSVDGQPACRLAEGDLVHVSASADVARFVRFTDRRFHQILKAKFGLADR